jgi:GNAT superfamily N-acetyltransferase
MPPSGPRQNIRIEPATADRWPDVVALFGPRGACGGCWCMYWRTTRSEFETLKGDGNRRRLKKLVAADPPPGVLAYLDDEPVGWCAIAPREAYESLARSRILKPVDDKPVWSITCLFVDKRHRRRGLSVRLIRGAVDLARDHGARLVEAYPIEPKKNEMPDVFAFVGLASAFTRAGFKEITRRSPTRPIMRRALRSRSAKSR